MPAMPEGGYWEGVAEAGKFGALMESLDLFYCCYWLLVTGFYSIKLLNEKVNFLTQEDNRIS